MVSFQTFMTGEMFALLAGNSVLRHGMHDEGWDAGCFATDLEDAMTRPQSIAARLFSLRAEGLLHGLGSAQTRAGLSGILIGLDLAGSRPYWLGRDVVLLGDTYLVSHYATALLTQGVPARKVDAETLKLGGLKASYRTLKESQT